MSKLIPLPEELPDFLSPYIPPTDFRPFDRPFTTLTYAQSLDSRIASKPGQRTSISHLETKTMTHYLRSKHEAILIGSGTVLADDPGLNCRYIDEFDNKHMIRPIILDPSVKWKYKGSKMEQIVKKGEGLAPFLLIRNNLVFTPEVSEQIDCLVEDGGAVLRIMSETGVPIDWSVILNRLYLEGISSVMIEGGARVINDLLLRPELIDSVIITVGPVFLGDEGVKVSPNGEIRMKDLKWWSGVQDSVVCGRILKLDD